jgi:hypothetical protein
MSTRVGLVGCASTKLKHPAPARELYTSQLFRKASAFAEATCDRWYVLSAKHGLVAPDRVLAPYDVKLGRAHRDPDKDAPPIHDWAKRVAWQLAEVLDDYALAEVEIVVLAGEQYRTFLRYAAGWRFEVPMKGLGLGEQLGWLTRALSDLAVKV